MAAHLRPLPKCQHYGCEKPATCELRNTWNAVTGTFCDKHGKQALREFEQRFPEQATR